MVMKKIAVLAVILILANGFMACKGKKSGESAGTGGSSAGGGKVQITYSFWGTPDEAKDVQKVADKFNGQQDRIQVTVVQIPHDTYEATLNTRATAGQLPDCGIMSEAATLQYATNGLLADISGMYGAGESKPLDSLAFKPWLTRSLTKSFCFTTTRICSTRPA